MATSAGALVAWVALLLGTLQIANITNARWLLKQDFALVLSALAGYSASILFIVSRSRLSLHGRLVLVAAGMVAFLFMAFWGVLFVACANGSCL
jgi:hypothetical protein